MAILPRYSDGPLFQVALGKYNNAATLVANIATTLTVPTDDEGKLAKYVTFGRGANTTDTFYAQCFNTNDSFDRTTGGTFAAYTTNGTFASDTAWTKGTGWTIGAGVATAVTATSTLTQPAAIALIPGQSYTITFDATRSAGTVTASIGGTAGTARSSSATFTEAVVAGSDGTITFTGVGFSGTIDNVIVTAWVLGAGWTTDNTTAIATGAISTAISQTTNVSYPFVNGQTYLVKFDLTRSAGSIAVSLGGGTAGTSRSTSATFSEVITAGSTQAISFAASAFTGTLDNVSILACAGVPTNVTNGLGPEENPTGYFLGSTANGAATVSIVSATTPIITASFYK